MSRAFAPLRADTEVPRDPADTLVVIGGTGLASIDAAGVRIAAARLADARDGLRQAAGLAGAAWGEVAAGATILAPDGFGPAGTADGGRAASGPTVWTGVSWHAAPGRGAGTAPGPVPGVEPFATAARRTACEAIEAVTSGLGVRADALDRLARRLLRAAGLYEEAEGLVERLIGGLVTAEGFVIGAAIGVAPVLDVLGGAYRAAGVLGGAGVPGGVGVGTGGGPAGTGRASPGESVDGRRARAGEREDGDHGRTAGGFGGDVVRGVARWTDELAYGFAHGLARSAGERPGVPGAAAALAGATRAAPGPAVGDGVRLERVGAAGFAVAPPAWRDAGAGTIDEALGRVDDLYPRSGAPEGTVAVQRVSGPGGVTTWTVLVPGTQSVLPAAHPWDGLTDLELVAEHPDQVTQAVEEAMSEAGIGPDEPVVLVGHSLGGIAVTALAGRPAFVDRYRIGGVVTAGAPVATFRTAPGVPVLHLETAEEVVSNVDGRSSTENPRTPDRVTVGRTLSDSPAAEDRTASGDTSGAHSVRTHARTLALARESGDVRVAGVVDRIEPFLRGDVAETAFYRAERTTPTSPEPAPSPGPPAQPSSCPTGSSPARPSSRPAGPSPAS